MMKISVPMIIASMASFQTVDAVQAAKPTGSVDAVQAAKRQVILDHGFILNGDFDDEAISKKSFYKKDLAFYKKSGMVSPAKNFAAVRRTMERVKTAQQKARADGKPVGIKKWDSSMTKQM
jgi:hypothetical protein